MSTSQKHQPNTYKNLTYIALLFMVTSFVLMGIYLNKLPEKVPIHFGLSGKSDGLSEKSMLWLIPSVQAFVVVLISLVKNADPKNFNYPIKVNNDNKLVLHQLSLWMLSVLAVVVSLFFTILFWQTLEVAIGATDKLSTALIIGFIIAVLTTIVIYFKRARAHK